MGPMVTAVELIEASFPFSMLRMVTTIFFLVFINVLIAECAVTSHYIDASQQLIASIVIFVTGYDPEVFRKISTVSRSCHWDIVGCRCI